MDIVVLLAAMSALISAPSFSRNDKHERDPEMHQTRQGNQWYFGMKRHVGEDSWENAIHSTKVTEANMHDSQMVSGLLHGAEMEVWGDSAKQGQTEAIQAAASAAQDLVHRRGSRGHRLSAQLRAKNAAKSRVRAKGEHPLPIIKRVFGFTRVRHRGSVENETRFRVLYALADLYIKRRLLTRQRNQ